VLDQSNSCRPSCEARQRLPVPSNEVNHRLQSLHALCSMTADYIDIKTRGAQRTIKLGPVRLMIRNSLMTGKDRLKWLGHLTWFGHVEHNDDTDWIKHSTMMKAETTKRDV